MKDCELNISLKLLVEDDVVLVVSVIAVAKYWKLVISEVEGLGRPSCWTTLAGDISLAAKPLMKSERRGLSVATRESID